MSRTNRFEKRHEDDRNTQTAEMITSGRPARRAGLLVCLFAAFAAAFFLTGTLRAQAGTGSSKTKVITTSTDESFAIESAKLAKKNRGLSVKSNGKARPYSSARLIVGMKSGKKVDFSKYKASTVVESSFGVSIVQFSSESAAKKAAASLKKLSSVRYVDADDCTLDLGDTEIKKIYYDESSYEKDMGTASLSRDAADAATYDKSKLNNLDYVYDATIKQNAVTASSSAMSWGVSVLQADKYAAYVKGYTARSVKVAVVDSGVSSHPRMEGRILSGIDLVDNDHNAADQNGHGTHVAGTIVDCTPGIKVYIIPVRVMNSSGEGSPSVVGNGVRYAVSKGAKVINLSLGGYSHYQYLEDCINYAHNNGVTVVIASGNENENTSRVCPAHMTNPIIVGAIDRDNKRSYYSNYGSSLDLVAPGDNIVSCWMGGGYAVASGTSMAAPHISAVAAMYRLMYPTYGSSKATILLRSFVQDLGASGWDAYYGKGVPKMTGPIKPTKVTLNKKTAKVEVKKTLTLKATLTPSYAGQKKLTWTSSNTAVATVSSSGKVTAKKKGTATITAEAVGGKKASCKVTVIGVQPTGVTLNLSKKTLQVGASVTLKATVSPSNAENKTLTWKTGSNSVATVHEGTVKARGAGTITITAITANGKKAACKVTVVPKATVSTSARSQPVVLADEEALSAMPSAAAREIAADDETDAAPARAAAAENAKAIPDLPAAEEEDADASEDRSAPVEENVPAPSDRFTEEEETSDQSVQVPEEESLTESAAFVEAPVETEDTDPFLAAAEEENGIFAPQSDETAEDFSDPEAENLFDPEAENLFDPEAENDPDLEAENLFDPAAENDPDPEAENDPDLAAENPSEPGTADSPEPESEYSFAEEAENAPDPAVDFQETQDQIPAPVLFLDKGEYTAASGEGAVELQAHVRLPGTADPALSGQEDQSPADAGDGPGSAAQIRNTDYVLAMLREEQDGTRTLLGAVDLAPGPDTDPASSCTGILSQTGAVKKEDAWKLSLAADLSPWMKEPAPGEYTDRVTTWNCILAVYDRQTFEERQYASSVPDPESCSLIDAEALCSCPFTLNIKTAAVSAE